MIGNELDDPRLSLVRVTNVEVSRDLRNVNVHVTHDDEELSKREVIKGLRNATPYLRRQIAIRGSLRAVPELVFHYDDTPERAARVDELLRQIAASRGENGDGSPPPASPESSSPTSQSSTSQSPASQSPASQSPTPPNAPQ